MYGARTWISKVAWVVRDCFSMFLARARARKVVSHVKGRVLDVGCGSGTILKFLPGGIDYVGVEIDPHLVEMLLDSYPGATAYSLDIQREAVSGEKPFDTILALALIEHLERPLDFLELYVPLLAVGGAIVVTTPTRFGDRIHGVLQRLGIASPVVGEVHFHIYRLSELKTVLEGQGLEIVVAVRFQVGMNQLVVGRRNEAGDSR